MIEVRTFVETLEPARKILLEQSAEFKGEYGITDYIYKSKDSTKSLTDTFLRLRVYSKNIWNEKDVIVAIKNTELKQQGKNSIIPLRMEFDTKEEGEKYIQDNLLNQFEYDFSFYRIGWQYNLGDDQIDLEDIENGTYSIEIKSPTEEGIQRLVELFDIKDLITGPSVVAVRGLVKS